MSSIACTISLKSQSGTDEEEDETECGRKGDKVLRNSVTCDDVILLIIFLYLNVAILLESNIFLLLLVNS